MGGRAAGQVLTVTVVTHQTLAWLVHWVTVPICWCLPTKPHPVSDWLVMAQLRWFVRFREPDGTLTKSETWIDERGYMQCQRVGTREASR